jgi:hypothetical protein
MKFYPSAIILITVVILTATEFLSAQTTTITEQDYWVGIRSGYTATEKIYPRRETKTYESLSDGKVTYSRTEVSEYQSKDVYHTTKTVVRDGSTIVTEAIQIGTVRYCRENTGEWKSSGCYRQPPSPLDDADETSYSVQKNKDGRTYIRIATLLKKATDKAEAANFLTEDRFVLNSDTSVRERSIIKTVMETKSIVLREISKFEYGVTLKIEAPIK